MLLSQTWSTPRNGAFLSQKDKFFRWFCLSHWCWVNLICFKRELDPSLPWIIFPIEKGIFSGVFICHFLTDQYCNPDGGLNPICHGTVPNFIGISGGVGSNPDANSHMLLVFVPIFYHWIFPRVCPLCPLESLEQTGYFGSVYSHPQIDGKVNPY